VDVGTDFDAVDECRKHVDAVDAVVPTHIHPDHVGNLDGVRAAFDVEVPGFDGDHPGVDRAVNDGDRLAIGDDEYVALHTPGHKDDHVCLYSPERGVPFAGDLIFAEGGFGRTDLPGGDRSTLVRSIERVRETVTDDLRAVNPGHGLSVTADPLITVDRALRAARRS